jgi:hypothetical protein
MFLKGVVHSSPSCVIPEKFRAEVMSSYCNYVSTVEDAMTTTGPVNVQNSFILSSWNDQPNVRHRRAMLVSWNCEEALRDAAFERNVTSEEAHPCLTRWQLFATAMLWPRCQGSRQKCAYFCGSAITPGNGHDLSFLSGICVTAKLGCTHPFSQDLNCQTDFERLNRILFGK